MMFSYVNADTWTTISCHLTSEDNLVLNELREHGESWIVGGWVRDVLMMKKSDADLDIATVLLPKK